MYRTAVEVKGKVVGVRWRVGEGFAKDREEVHRGSEEVQRRVEEAYRSGFEDGRRMGWEAAWREIEKAAEAFKKEVEALKEARDELLRGAEEGVLALAGEVARRLVRVAVERFPEEVVDLVRECLRRISERNRVVVRVNPEDVAVLEAHNEELLAFVEGPVEVEPDGGVPRGGCKVETRSGIVDGRLDGMLDEVERAIREKLELRYVPR